MRTVWNIVSFLATVHLLALILFIGWLWQSDRMSAERLETTRHLFAVTTAQAEEAALNAEKDAANEEETAAEARRAANPPLDSAAQANGLAVLKQQEAQSRRRLEAEKNLLQQQLNLAITRLSHQQKELDARQEAWTRSHQDEMERKNDEQFMLIVRQYEQVPPKQGKRMLMELIGQKQLPQAATYLNAMNVRASSKILKEFKTDSEITLATELLEHLRTQGQDDPPASDAEVATNLAAASSPGSTPPNANGSAANSP